MKGNVEVVELLIENDAKLNEKNINGTIPLHLAAKLCKMFMRGIDANDPNPTEIQSANDVY
jgi:ankyrin repeat protein